ncbi:DUF805 domain-containing protein [Pseudomonas luteola]
MNFYTQMWQNYCNFKGRTSRATFWKAFLIHFAVSTAIGALSYSLLNSNVLQLIYILASFLPYWGMCARRLHDAGFSGWLTLSVLVPVVGWITLLVLLTFKGNNTVNRYGIVP